MVCSRACTLAIGVESEAFLVSISRCEGVLGDSVSDWFMPGVPGCNIIQWAHCMQNKLVLLLGSTSVRTLGALGYLSSSEQPDTRLEALP